MKLITRALMAGFLLLAALLASGLNAATKAEPVADAITQTRANVVFMRHALAPGYGDPAHFA